MEQTTIFMKIRGQISTQVPRHADINEMVAKAIMYYLIPVSAGKFLLAGVDRQIHCFKWDSAE
jgi:hypothetical protein